MAAIRRLVPDKLLAALRLDPGAPVELTSDLERESRRRVAVAAAIGALTYLVFLVSEWTRIVAASRLERSVDVAHDAIGLGLCLALLLVALIRAIPDRIVLRIALFTPIVISALIATLLTWAGFIRTGFLSPPAWTVPVITLFPLLVPASPRTTMRVSIASALTLPAALAVLAATGRVRAHVADFWAISLTGAVAAVIAILAARTVHGSRRQAVAARRTGSYELIERLGQGGMGEVWSARHTFLERPAAVKLILADRLRGANEAREEMVKRFTREARVTASLRSPHTVELFDFGAASDGSLYYAMELLEGLNVERFVYLHGPLEPRRAVSWLTQACHSLGEAHARGLVHRDIKPANLFVCRYGRDADFVKVLDFGLSRPDPGERGAPLTETGEVLGTPGYMSPEQVFGLPTEARTDLYALGCVAYWLLAGRKPFEAGSVGELKKLHATSAPPPITGTTTPVPARLEHVVLACLSKDPSGRPESADALCAELNLCVEGGAWTAADAEEWWIRNPMKI